jgi:hypothetical protein
MGKLTLVLVAVAVPAVLALLLAAERQRSSERLHELGVAQRAVKRLEEVEKEHRLLKREHEALQHEATESANEIRLLTYRIEHISEQRDEARSFARHYRTRYFEYGGGDEQRVEPKWISNAHATSWPKVLSLHNPPVEGGQDGPD